MLSAIAVPAGTYPGFGGCDCVLPRSVLDRLVFFCRCDRPVARVQCGTATLHVKVFIQGFSQFCNPGAARVAAALRRCSAGAVRCYVLLSPVFCSCWSLFPGRCFGRKRGGPLSVAALSEH